MTDPIIAPTAKGWVLRREGHPVGPFKSFRDAQLHMRKLYGRQEFARRFPVTTEIIHAETHDLKAGGNARGPSI